MIKRELTCIICPRGCGITVCVEDGKPLSVTGNICKRGESYAITECTAPMRVVTSTVRCENGLMLPVKTDTAIPKEHIMDCMRIINSISPKPPVHIGDVLADDVYGSRIVASGNIK